MELESNVGMAKGPILYHRKQSYRELRRNWNAVKWPESLWNKYDISCKLPEVPVKRLLKVVIIIFYHW